VIFLVNLDDFFAMVCTDFHEECGFHLIRCRLIIISKYYYFVVVGVVLSSLSQYQYVVMLAISMSCSGEMVVFNFRKYNECL
jgi:hypothetical protein